MDYYSRIIKNMVITDYMALERTRLANERTFLAYSRTFIGTLSAGVGLFKFVDGSVFVVIGAILIGISPFILTFGLYRFFAIRARLGKLRDETIATTHQAVQEEQIDTD